MVKRFLENLQPKVGRLSSSALLRPVPKRRGDDRELESAIFRCVLFPNLLRSITHAPWRGDSYHRRRGFS